MSEKLITLGNLQSYDEKIKNYIDQHSGNTGTTYTVSNTEGSTKLINDADGSEQEILPFYVESSDIMPYDNVYLSDRFFIWGLNTNAEKEGPLFSSYTE
jgi:hypothetical protein